MRKIVTLLFFFVNSVLITAQSFHTINIDGNNDFSTANERFVTSGPEALLGYVTFDKDYLYFAFSGSSVWGSVTDNTRNFHIYVDSDPNLTITGGTGTVTGEGGYRYTPTLPFSANYHYVFRTTDNFETRRVYNNGSWQDAAFSTGNWKSNGYWEGKIKLADLGITGQCNVIAYVEENDNTGSICGGIPANVFTNTNAGGDITFNNHWLNVNLLDQITPNAVFHNTNSLWSIRLKTSGGSLVDSSAVAGMAANATNAYDAGIDLPKPPTVPSHYLEVFFPHSDWQTALGPNFMRDYRALVSLNATTSSWDFTIRTDLTNTSINLTADQFGFVPSNYNIFIQDITADSMHNVRTLGSYTFNSGNGGDKYFRLIVGVTLTEPNIQIEPAAYNFGIIKVSKDSTKTFSVTNTGDRDLVISNIVSSNTVFTFTGGTTYTIARNQTVTIPVTFRPAAAQNYSGTITISSNDADTPQLVIALSGTGQSLSPNIVVPVTALSFGTIGVEADSIKQLVVYNTGDTTLTISGISNVHSVFSIVSTLPVSVVKNDSTIIRVKFLPLLVSSYTDTLTIASNDPDSPSVKVAVTGTGSEVTLSHSYTAGWNLVSVPISQANASAGSVFGDDIASYVLYRYQNGGYVVADSVFAGNGFWLGIESAATVDVQGAPKTSTVQKTLSAGWNIVASPYSKSYDKGNVRFTKGSQNVSADSAAQLGWIQNMYYGYSRADSLYHVATVLAPWAGHWFAVLAEGVTAVYDYNKAATAESFTAPEAPVSNQNNWQVLVSAQIGRAKDNMLAFGVADQATAGFDNMYDLAKPPVSPENVTVRTYFTHADWNPYFQNYASDIKAPLNSAAAQWKFMVQSSAAGTVTLNWKDILTQIPEVVRNDYSFNLAGQGLSMPLDMETHFTHSYQAQAGMSYQFIISSVFTGIEGDEHKPLRFGLEQNYPNPFNPSTVISYQVVNSGRVTLKVYDVLGTEVRTLVDEMKNPGSYQVRFNAENLAAGAYFYKLVQGNAIQVKKLMYVK